MNTTSNGLELPLHSVWVETDAHVESLLHFVTATSLFQNLCGGVHVLDFLTRVPDIYDSVLPKEWRDWFEKVEVHDVLELLLRTETDDLLTVENLRGTGGRTLRNVPQSLREYVYEVRILCLERAFPSAHVEGPPSGDGDGARQLLMPRHISVGMKPKKIHEVSNFASLVARIGARPQNPHSTSEKGNMRIVDFGSGQNYLGRTLASPPYNQHVIAIERKHHNVDGARGLDVHAKLAKKEKVMRNKKEYKRRLAAMSGSRSTDLPTPPLSDLDPEPDMNEPSDVLARFTVRDDPEEVPPNERGSMTHVEHEITSGELESIVHSHMEEEKPSLMTVSLHSCGNLTHHALRSILNPSVRCVAAIGCCYNLLTERLGPATYKHPELHRSLHPRLVATSTAFDPQGFPMSQRLEEYTPQISPSGKHDADNDGGRGTGIRMNITARMMAVQAPGNWGREDSEMFFTRHFYRALLQRILLDCGVVKQGEGAMEGKDEDGKALIVGSLRKGAFETFEAYVRAALEKLIASEASARADESIKHRTRHLSPEIIQRYEQEYSHRRKHLAVMWSLMAFSAGVVESLIVVDRWLWLKEQDCVERAWVQTVFDYSISPRNLCVVGVKKKNS